MKTVEYTSPEIAEKLSGSGIKPSAQRILILRHLMSHRVHPTVDEIYTSLQPEHPTLSRTTVYNTLKLLSGAGIIKAIAVENGESTRWDYSEHPHAHFLCMSCGSVTDIPAVSTDLPSLPEGYSIIDIGVTCKGRCPECSRLLQSESNN